MRSIVTEHFPDFGWYHAIWESHKINEDAELTTGDSIDDLTDIIKDFIEVQWRLENNSEKDGLYQFEFLMKHHSEQHIGASSYSLSRNNYNELNDEVFERYISSYIFLITISTK